MLIDWIIRCSYLLLFFSSLFISAINLFLKPKKSTLRIWSWKCGVNDCMKYKLNNEINIHNHNNWNQAKIETNKTSAKIESKLMHGPNAHVSNICVYHTRLHIHTPNLHYIHTHISVGRFVCSATDLPIYRYIVSSNIT